MMQRLFAVLMIYLSIASGALAQDNVPPQTSTVDTNPAVSTLEDILSRQELSLIHI